MAQVEVGKYVNGVKVDSKRLRYEYSQGIIIPSPYNFSPFKYNCRGIWQTIVLDTNNADIDVSAFWVKPCNKMRILMISCIVWYKQEGILHQQQMQEKTKA